MKKQPVSPTRVASCCLSPAEVWHILLTHLLAQHYGLTLSDTPFGEEDTIQAHIDAGVPMAEALNAVVEMYDLVRTDRDNACFILGSPLITTIDVLRARKATGLLKRGTYQVLSHIMQGRRHAPDSAITAGPSTSLPLLLAQLREAAGVDYFTPHDLRRTFITQLLEQGTDLNVVRQLAGHADIATTTRYDYRGRGMLDRASRAFCCW